MTIVFLFLFGAAIGSFVNVVALRYDPDLFLFARKRIGGRSRCPHCGKTLRWFELIPLVSFALAGGRCLTCHARVSIQYPLVEVLSGLIFILVPLRLDGFMAHGLWFMDALWISVFESLLLMSLIDIRLQIIPDEINIFLLALGLVALVFPMNHEPSTSYLLGALFALFFFSLIILTTRGRGMGLGDVKLAAPLGLLFGWPDILILTVSSFIVGSAFGLYAMVFKNKNMKSAVPFGPFLALGAVITFFAGREIAYLYLGFMGIR